MVTTIMKLIINADDGFYSEPRDLGIVRALKHGTVTDVSVLVNGSVVESLIQCSLRRGVSSLYDYLMEYDIIPGLHLNLTEGRPLLSDSKTFVNEHNEMLGKHGLMKVIAEGKELSVNLIEVEKEIELQLERFIAMFGERPSHVDGHQHAHILPGINVKVAQILQKFNVRFMRLPIETLPSHLDNNPLKDFYAQVVMYSKQSLEGCFHDNGLRSPHFVGMSVMSENLTTENVECALSEYINNKRTLDHCKILSDTIELMVHPGYQSTKDGGCSSGGPDHFSKSPERFKELLVLESPEFKNMLNRLQIVLTNFSSL